MRNSIETIIAELRSLILDKIKDSCGFSSEEVTERDFARHRGSAKKDFQAWESVLFRKSKIDIFLTFETSKSSDPAYQKINLHGNTFYVRLFIYDTLRIDYQTSTKKACDCLLGKISENGIYGITKVSEINRKPAKDNKKTVGHVLNLYIKNTNKDWSILSPDQIEKASDDLVDKVVATLKDLLPVAKYYADNREKLLSEKN